MARGRSRKKGQFNMDFIYCQRTEKEMKDMESVDDNLKAEDKLFLTQGRHLCSSTGPKKAKKFCLRNVLDLDHELYSSSDYATFDSHIRAQFVERNRMVYGFMVEKKFIPFVLLSH
jgi:hypothetical protein